MLMIYQLPNGKIIHISVEEFLDLSDQDIQYMMSINAGDHAPSPFYGSVIKNPGAKDYSPSYENDIDYTPDDEDRSHGDNPQGNEILLDEFPDIPDTETETID